MPAPPWGGTGFVLLANMFFCAKKVFLTGEIMRQSLMFKNVTDGYRFDECVVRMVKRPYFLGRITKRGFTLVELLVVISIIALLLAVLMPALQKARNNAKALACKSNIAQLALAATAYSMDNKDKYSPVWFQDAINTPPGGYWGTGQWKDYWWWPQIMSKYLGDQYELARCSAGLSKRLSPKPISGNYGFNIHVVGNGSDQYPAVKQMNVRRPSGVILACDSGTFYALDLMASVLRDGNEYLPGMYATGTVNKNLFNLMSPWAKTDVKIGRHPEKRICIGFVDGHSDWVKVSTLKQPTSYWLASR